MLFLIGLFLLLLIPQNLQAKPDLYQSIMQHNWEPCKASKGDKDQVYIFQCPYGEIDVMIYPNSHIQLLRTSMPHNKAGMILQDIQNVVNKYKKTSSYDDTDEWMNWIAWWMIISISLIYLLFFYSMKYLKSDAKPEDWLTITIITAIGLALRLILPHWQNHDLSLYFPGMIRNIPMAWTTHTSLQVPLKVFYLILGYIARPVATSWDYYFIFNAILSGLTLIPLYLVVKDISNSMAIAIITTLLVATHPDIVRFAPTDCAHNLMMFNMIWGMWLLRHNKSLLQGIGISMLIVGAGFRPEGMVIAISALLFARRDSLYEALKNKLVLVGLILLLMPLLIGIGYTDHIRVSSKVNAGDIGFLNLLNLPENLFWLIMPVKYPFFSGWRLDITGLFVRSLIVYAFVGRHKWRRLTKMSVLAAFIAVLPVAYICSLTSILYAEDIIPALYFIYIAVGIGIWHFIEAHIKTRKRVLAIASAAILSTFSLAEHYSWLRYQASYNIEFALLRKYTPVLLSHPPLITWRVLERDRGMYDLVINDINCRYSTCRKNLSGLYYFRDTSCFKKGSGNKDGYCLMDPDCKVFEEHLTLKPVEIKTVAFTFSRGQKTCNAKIGLFLIKNQKDMVFDRNDH